MIGYLLVLAGAIALIYYGGFLAIAVLKFKAGWFTLIAAAGIMLVVIMFFVFIIKFMFKIKKEENKNTVEIHEKEHPKLFAFIKKVCEETKAPFPKKIVISPSVNACVYYNSSFLSMFFPVRKNLEIGLGLVSCVNMTEFKAIIAHEFGHFSQSSTRLGSYVYRFNHMIHNLLYDNDGWANALTSFSSVHVILGFFGQITIGMAKLVLSFFIQLYKLININYLSLSREMEFHADSVAVSVTGSEPIITALYRLEFAASAYNYTIKGIIDHCKNEKCYPKNFFSLLERNIKTLASLNQLSLDNGLPVIDPEKISKDVLENRVKYKDIWATHPPTEERAINAKKIFLKADMVKNSPWELFNDPLKLQQDLSLHLVELGSQTNTAIENDELVAYFEKEEKDNFLNPIYKDLYTYSGHINTTPDINGSSAVKDLEINDLFGDDIIVKMKRHSKNIYDTELMKNISEGHIEIKRFEFDGKKYTRYYSADIYKQLKKETEDEELLIKAHMQKISDWFYFKIENKDTSLARQYLLLKSFKQRMEDDRKPLVDLFEKIVSFYHQELNRSIHEEDLPGLRKKIQEQFNDYLKIRQNILEGVVPEILIKEEILDICYKDTVFKKQIIDPCIDNNLEGFIPFVNALEELIHDWLKLDTRVHNVIIKTQDEILVKAGVLSN